MKLGGFLAVTIPELRKMTGGQLLKVWSGCTPYSRGKLYLHVVLLLACSSAIFNTVMRLSDAFYFDMVGLVIGLFLPPNIYFHFLFKDRRAEVRQFIQENWEEFRP